MSIVEASASASAIAVPALMVGLATYLSFAPTMKYFAYGSNMSGPVMDLASPAHRFLGAARLPGYRLAFMRRSLRTGTGVADIVPDPNATAWGALYELEPDQLALLDAKETLGAGYEHLDVILQTEAGASHQAMAYAVITKELVEVRPSLEYVRRLVTGAHERSLPEDYVASLEALVLDWELESLTPG